MGLRVFDAAYDVSITKLIEDIIRCLNTRTTGDPKAVSTFEILGQDLKLWGPCRCGRCSSRLIERCPSGGAG